MDLKFGKYPSLSCVPAGIVDNVRLMLHYNPDTRPNLHELTKVKIEFQLHPEQRDSKFVYFSISDVLLR